MSTIGMGVISFAHGHANAYCQKMVPFDDVKLVACWDDDKKRGERIAAVPRPFVDALKNGTPPPATALDGKKSVEMILGAYQSAKEGRRVLFPM